MRIRRLPALRDNLVPLLEHPRQRQAAVVDPADAGPVITALEHGEMELAAVLHTHHHWDHVGGTAELLRRWPQAMVVGHHEDQHRLPPLSHPVTDGDRFTLLGRAVEVLAIPGHTVGHIAYVLPACVANGQRQQPELLCGDTLFSCGCGRLFEGTPAQMLSSLQRLAALPPDTRIWCAHEYTATNVAFALGQDPHNPALQAFAQQVEQLRQARLPTIPSHLEVELQVNPFLRCHTPALQEATGKTDPVDVLAELRQRRNQV
ncbi:MAG: hydroxyacylglutathione hydrolase [Synechococcus sp. SB0665_bin_28]|nr:hydroxyacylglutathione hydrolase [Synechococcus sp. SB0665_bin_28]MYF19420.1 hydroxyacylglutathione hydrolase [Synechococcus sp. SB0677_bin_5]